MKVFAMKVFAMRGGWQNAALELSVQENLSRRGQAVVLPVDALGAAYV